MIESGFVNVLTNVWIFENRFKITRIDDSTLKGNPHSSRNPIIKRKNLIFDNVHGMRNTDDLSNPNLGYSLSNPMFRKDGFFAEGFEKSFCQTAIYDLVYADKASDRECLNEMSKNKN